MNHFARLGLDPTEPLDANKINQAFIQKRARNDRDWQNNKQMKDQNERELLTSKKKLEEFLHDPDAKDNYLKQNNLIANNAAQNQASNNANNNGKPGLLTAAKNRRDQENKTQKELFDRRHPNLAIRNPSDGLLLYVYLEKGVYDRNMIAPDPTFTPQGYDDINVEEFTVSNKDVSDFGKLVKDYEDRGELILTNPNGHPPLYEYADANVKKRFEADIQNLRANPNAPTPQQNQGNQPPRLGIRSH